MITVAGTPEIFFTADYSRRTDSTGHVSERFQNFLGHMFSELERRSDLRIYCPVREAGWQVSSEQPMDAAQEDLRSIERSVGIIAFIGKRYSPSVYAELGYGVACNKLPIVACKPEVHISAMHPVIDNFPYVRHAYADDPGELAERITRHIAAVDKQ